MLVTLILRLVAEPLADGEVVGEVEHVGGGNTRFNGVEELIQFARGAAAPEDEQQAP